VYIVSLVTVWLGDTVHAVPEPPVIVVGIARFPVESVTICPIAKPVPLLAVILVPLIDPVKDVPGKNPVKLPNAG
jgi:hypothetical protein